MKKKPWQTAMLIGIVLAGLLVAAQLTDNRGVPTVDQLVEFYKDLPKSGMGIGNAAAPVTVIEYFDFQCPACQVASESIVKPIIDEYVRAGDVNFVYRVFPILGPESVAAAEAAYCAAVDGMFWEYQADLFARKGTGNRGTYSKENLLASATRLGLDRDSFLACLDSPQARSFVQTSYQQALGMNLPGTPTFFVNGRHVPGTKQAIEAAIEEALALARGSQR